MVKVTGRKAEEVEEIILQGIGNPERRNILRIIGSAPEGVIYSEILNELKLNTGKLNYHLKLLEGLIERDDQRHYHLTKLGRKSLQVLGSMTEDLDDEALSLASSAKGKKDDLITGVVNLWTRLVLLGSLSAFLGLVVFINTSVRAGYSGETAYLWLTLPAGLMVVAYIWLEKVRRETPEKIVEFLARLGIYK